MKRRQSVTLALSLMLAVLVFATACSKSTNSTNSSNGSSSANASNSNKPTTTISPSTTSLSPTAVFNAYYDAMAKKDVAAAKKYLSQGTLTMMEDVAKKMGSTVDNMMKDSPVEARPQLSNEKISGDTATVDLTADGRTQPVPFVKEGGEWKLALDKLATAGGPTGGPTQGDDEDEHDGH